MFSPRAINPPPFARWVRCLQPQPRARARLVCLPHAGAGASLFYSWVRPLAAAGIEVRAVQYPGREDRLDEPAIDRCEPMVGALLAAWPEVSGGGPCFVFGHSMGAAIAHALAGELVRQGRPGRPLRLFLSGRNPPHARPDLPAIHGLPDEEFLAQLIAQRDARLPAELLADADMKAMIISILRADYALSETPARNPDRPLDIPFTIFGGTDDPWTSVGALAEWKRYSTRPCHLHMVKGDHFFHQSATAEVIAAIVRDVTAVAAGEARA